jgi:predicted porin
LGRQLQRQFLGASYDFGAAKVNYIMANASTSGKGEVKTNTVGIRIPMDKVTLALSVGSGSYSNAAAYSGVANIAGNLEDTTFGAFYNFDKSTSAYFFTSRSKNTVTQSTGDTDHTAGTVGKSNTSTLGLRYSY